MKEELCHDTQMRKVYAALYNGRKTMKEVFVETGVLREFVCRYIANMRKANTVFMTGLRKCKITGTDGVKEWTTNEKFVPDRPKQGKLF